MTAATLRSLTAKDLAKMARERGVAGWHSMRKEELIGALVRVSRRRASAESKGVVNGRHNGHVETPTRRDFQAQRKLSQLQDKLAQVRNLAASSEELQARQDRLVVMVRDPYWLHAYWELSPRSIDRAQAAMGQRWHGAKPVIRVLKIQPDSAALHERDIQIHGGVRNWYVDVQDPPADYRLEIGYLSIDGSFYCLARSNEVSTPPAGTSDAVDDNWTAVAENADRIFAMSGGYSAQGASRELQELLEERLRRPLGTPMKTRYGSGAAGRDGEQLDFAVDAEIIVYGAANRDAHVTLQGEPVQLREDGTFAVRLSLPDRRQVIPIVASSYDGVEQRTTILAVERNTKVMEPLTRDFVDNSF
ncbi:DUF4912 domain-containing protein [Lacipirellula limnantheis]|uniref:Rho termination factor-like N-terminal domain-containing protein n=1 Tax=Lacipirellula limnantheis TaxID=2528024 RepID=A0A517U045_9BACT|nr:DUF4912 domain-containing protein [Lacipirellula limnantheis]QDT74009.1 hypothetical protein I41_32020 [Lacipirellula limnantheis]